MTAKEYLNQASHLDALINSRLCEIDYWKDLSNSVSGSGFETHHNSNRPTEEPFACCIEKIDAIQRSVEETVAHLIWTNTSAAPMSTASTAERGNTSVAATQRRIPSVR